MAKTTTMSTEGGDRLKSQRRERSDGPAMKRRRWKKRAKQLKPPCEYESLYSSYLKEWEHQRQEQNQKRPPHVEINDFLVSKLKGEESLVVVAATSLGQVIVKRLKGNKNHASDSKLVWKVTNQPLRTIALLAADDNETVFVVGGDEGMWTLSIDTGYDWWNVDSTATKQKVEPIKQASDSVQEIRIAPHPKGVNTIIYALTEQGQILKYDSPTLLKQKRTDPIRVYNNPSKPATAFHVVSGSDSPFSMILIGTAVAEVLVLDLMKAKVVDTLSITKVFGTPTKQQHPPTTSAQPKKYTSYTNHFYKVTSIVVMQDQWWTVGGVHSNASSKDGGGRSNSGNTSSHIGGFLCTWHGPTRAVVAHTETREQIQGLLVTPQQRQCSEIYSIANEAVVSVWNSPYQLQRTHRVQIHSPSGKTFAVVDDHVLETTAQDKLLQPPQVALLVAGVGSQMDFLKDHCCVETLELT